MEPSHARTRGWTDSAEGWVGRPGRRLTCLLTPLHPERALSGLLVQHLSEEMPDIDFVLAGAERPDVVWICGFEPGAEELVRDLRRRDPQAFLVVTGRGPVESWGASARAVGADFCCGWPVPVAELARILRAPLRVGPS